MHLGRSFMLSTAIVQTKNVRYKQHGHYYAVNKGEMPWADEEPCRDCKVEVE